jgi:hypothetical protein
MDLIREPSFIFSAMAVVGMLAHFFKKAYRGETGWNLLDYLLMDHPGNSAGMIGALVLGCWAVVTSNTLSGATMSLIVGSGFGLGWTLDSAVNKAKTLQDTASKQSGFVRLELLAVLAAVAMLVGCAASGARMPQGPLEQIEAAEITAQEVSASIVRLTCTKYLATKCIEPGKSFGAEEGIKLHDRVQDARQALRAAKAIGSGQVGACLGEQRTQIACIAAARLVINELERKVLEQQAGR